MKIYANLLGGRNQLIFNLILILVMKMNSKTIVPLLAVVTILVLITYVQGKKEKNEGLNGNRKQHFRQKAANLQTVKRQGKKGKQNLIANKGINNGSKRKINRKRQKPKQKYAKRNKVGDNFKKRKQKNPKPNKIRCAIKAEALIRVKFLLTK